MDSTIYHSVRGALKRSWQNNDVCCHEAVREAIEDICLSMDWSVDEYEKLTKEIESHE